VAVGTTTIRAPGPRTRVRRWASGFKERETWWAYGFISLWLVGFLVFSFGPMIASLVLSFTDYSVIGTTHGVGWSNYHQIVHDPYIKTSLENTAIFTPLYVVGTMVFALCLAMMLSRIGQAAGFFRTAFYLPVLTPPVAQGILYLLLFNGTYGLVDRALAIVHIPQPFWETDPNWVKPGLVFMMLWQVGANVVIYLAAIKGVPRQLYEAAEMDGAPAWRRFKDVTLPMISPALFFTFIILTINGIQIFAQIYTAYYFNPNGTSSGGDASLTYVIYLFQQAFVDFHIGYASAMAWLLFLVIAVITTVQFIGSRRFVYYQGGQPK
jgi:multiple sugar transport system permease protein